MPRVTVLTTLYNKGAFVEEAVRSALASTFADIEVLVVDDASTDDGPARVRAIADPRVRLLPSERNTGRPAAANRGFEAACGEYIAVLDADDVMHPERIARQAAFLDAHPEVGAVGSALAILDRPGEVWRWDTDDEPARAKLLFQGPVSYGAMMLRRNLLTSHGLRCDDGWRTPGMDYLFVAKIAPHARYANLPEALTFYRVGENNMRHGRDQAADRAMLMRELLRRFGIAASEEEVDAHVMLFGMQRRPADARMARALRRWVDRLIAENRARGHFPQAAFEAEVRRRWQARFHAFADHSVRAAAAFAMHDRKLTLARLRYAAAAAWSRLANHRSSRSSQNS